MSTPKLDYVPRLVEANRDYRVSVGMLQQVFLEKLPRYWQPGRVITDQGQEGACVGFGVVNEAMASPNRQLRSYRSTDADRVSHEVYNAAKTIDEWEGVDYEGTSVRAGMLVGRQQGWWEGFRWAMNMAELRAALEEGPVVLGIDWTEDAYDAPKGVLKFTGEVVGGHCILATGYKPYHPAFRGPAYRLRNSWGKDWGVNGSAYCSALELQAVLFTAGGEAAVPVGRK